MTFRFVLTDRIKNQHIFMIKKCFYCDGRCVLSILLIQLKISILVARLTLFFFHIVMYRVWLILMMASNPSYHHWPAHFIQQQADITKSIQKEYTGDNVPSPGVASINYRYLNLIGTTMNTRCSVAPSMDLASEYCL